MDARCFASERDAAAARRGIRLIARLAAIRLAAIRVGARLVAPSLVAPRLLAMLLLLAAGQIALVPAAPAQAQDFGRVLSPILTLDRDRLFAGTLYGQRVNRELEAASNAMAAETRSIEAALEAEEKALTEKRATMDPEAFRERAAAFDDKVQALRAERAAAEDDLGKQIDAAQLAFFNRIGPVLGQLVREHGAVAIIDRRAVLLAATDIDITNDAIQRIDAVLGDGGDLGRDSGSDTGGDSGGDSGGDQSPAVVPDAAQDATSGEGAVGVDTIPAPVPPSQQPDTTPAE